MSFSDNPEKLEKDVKAIKFRWHTHTQNYIKTFPDAKLDINSVPNDRAYNAIMKVMSDIRMLEAHLKGKVNTATSFITNMDKRISNIKLKYKNEKTVLDSTLANNVAGKPLKVDKYDENSQSYVYTSYYTIGILTMYFFIYKQLQE
jgi:hypothetical protein